MPTTNTTGVLTEKPVGICPACGQAVYNSDEGSDGPVWTCPSDLSPQNAFYQKSPVTGYHKRRHQDW